LYLHLLRDHTDLPSFPTRRSSDLEVDRGAVIGIQPRPSILGPAGKLDRGIDGLRPGSALALVLGSVPRPVADPEDHSVLVGPGRSEEHTSELQSRENLVCRLLLEK